MEESGCRGSLIGHLRTNHNTVIPRGRGYQARRIRRFSGKADRRTLVPCIEGSPANSAKVPSPDLPAAPFAKLFGWVESGDLKPLGTMTYKLDEVPQALEDLPGRKARGKILVVP